MEATSRAPLPPRPGDQYRLLNLRSSMRNVMTMRSKMSSAISTTDSTEEPNHRLHWLPRLDRRVTICEGKRHTDHWGRGPRVGSGRGAPFSLPEVLSHPSQRLSGPLDHFCPSHTHLAHPSLPLPPRGFIPQPSSPSPNPLNLTLTLHPSPWSPTFKAQILWPNKGNPLFSLTPQKITGSVRQDVP